MLTQRQIQFMPLKKRNEWLVRYLTEHRQITPENVYYLLPFSSSQFESIVRWNRDYDEEYIIMWDNDNWCYRLEERPRDHKIYIHWRFDYFLKALRRIENMNNHALQKWPGNPEAKFFGYMLSQMIEHVERVLVESTEEVEEANGRYATEA